MALAGAGVLAIWNGIAAQAEADFIAWHMREHIPERVATPGFLRGRRYVSERGAPKFFNFYETESPQTLSSPDYLARLNAPSAWTQRVVRHFCDTTRTICAVAASRGVGDGAFVATLRLSARMDRAAFLGLVGDAAIGALCRSPSIVAAHLLVGQGGGASTAEKALRGGPDATAEWILLVEASDRAALETALADSAVASALKDAATEYDADRDCGVYRLQFALSREQLR